MDINELGTSLKKDINNISVDNLTPSIEVKQSPNDLLLQSKPIIDNNISNDNLTKPETLKVETNISNPETNELKSIIKNEELIDDNKPKKRVKFNNDENITNETNELIKNDNEIIVNDKLHNSKNTIITFIKSHLQTLIFLIIMFILYIIFYYIHNIKEDNFKSISSQYNINKKIEF